MTRLLRIGTRGSALAMVQARWTAARLEEAGVETELVVIRTDGDERAPGTAWGEGAFVARIAAALAEGRIDVAVHSAKDLPTDEHPALVVAAFPAREDPRDALVARVRGTTLDALPVGARVGTDSPRRTAFLRARRPDLTVHPLDGNVDTRLAKLDAGQSDALVLAVAGLARLGRAGRIDEILGPDVVLPAPGQGSLAVQVRADDAEARAVVATFDDPATRAAVEAERAFLSATGGGCRAPIGALATVVGDEITIRAGVARALPGVVEPVAWLEERGPVPDGATLAERLAGRAVRLRTRARVLLTRPDPEAEPLVAALADLGIESVVVPAIEVRVAAPRSGLAPALGALPEHEASQSSRDRFAAALAAGPIDALVFSSGSTARGFAALADKRGLDRLRARPAVCIGGSTTAVVRALGFERVETSPSPALLDLALAVARLVAPLTPADRQLAGSPAPEPTGAAS